jgi:hypothetical protein
MRGFSAFHPKIYGGNFASALYNFVRKTNLIVKFQRARLHGECARSRSRLGSFINDSDAHAQVGEPQSEHQASRARANDQDVYTAGIC